MRQLIWTSATWIGLIAIALSPIGAILGFLIAFSAVMIVAPITLLASLSGLPITPQDVAIFLVSLMGIGIVGTSIYGIVELRRRNTEAAGICWSISVTLAGFIVAGWLSNRALQEAWPT